MIITGLDIGSSSIRVVAASFRGLKPEDKNLLSGVQILGTGYSASGGVRRGIVVDIADVAGAIQQAVKEATNVAGVSLKRVVVGVNGAHLEGSPSRGVVAVSRADREITEGDVNRAVRAAEAISTAQNREILQVIARSFNIDSEKGIKNPVGMNGVRLEVDSLVITGSSPFLKNLDKALEQSGLEKGLSVPSPIASAEAVLDKKQKELGVLVLDIGAETTSLAVYEEGEIVHLKVLPIGSALITSDIAIGLRIDLDTAELIKIKYGSALSAEIRKTEVINLADLGLDEQARVRRQEVSEIIEARLGELFAMVNKELEKIGRRGFLPAGVILVGGGVKLPGLLELAKKELELPGRIGYPQGVGGLVDRVTDPAYVKAMGLVLAGLQESAKQPSFAAEKTDSFLRPIKNFFRNLLP